jgi:hypothetical protein
MESTKDAFDVLRDKLSSYEKYEDKLELLLNIRKVQNILGSITAGWDVLLSMERVADMEEPILKEFLSGSLKLVNDYLDVSDTFASKLEIEARKKIIPEKTMAI